jgi:Ca-activated chloride channel family protein
VRADAVEGSDMESGHTMTALYEIVPANAESPSRELLAVKLHYRLPGGDISDKSLEFGLNDTGAAWDQSSPDFRFAAAVAGFGMILADESDRGNMDWPSVAQWAREGLGTDPTGNRRAFLGLIDRAMRAAP